jgi:hypothetical protein
MAAILRVTRARPNGDDLDFRRLQLGRQIERIQEFSAASRTEGEAD